MLTLEGVSRRYAGGTLALDGVTLTVRRGGFMVLLGPSGCGKSTLLRLIAGLDTPDGGRLDWEGGARPGPGRIGMVFQDPVLLPWADARANAALPLLLTGQDRTRAEAAATDLLAELGLEGFAHVRPAALSGGMRMRVALARALATGPDLLLLDEPFAALDEPTRHRLQEELRRLHARRGMTIVLVTHSLYEAAFCAQSVALFTARPGRIARVMEMPAHQGRLDPAYLRAVAELGATMGAAVPAAA
jgi:NitT/TauT family transport system ATP-binding protein